MPQGTVAEHKNGNVTLRVPFDASATHYRFYTNEVGSGDLKGMVARGPELAVPAEAPTGFYTFIISDETLALRPDRGWHTRITKKIAGVESVLASEPPSLIRESDGGGKTIGAETTGAVFDGTAGKGLFFFGQRERTRLIRARSEFGASTNYTLSLVTASGGTSILDEGSGQTQFTFFPPNFFLEVGDKITLTTSASGNHKAEVTRE